MFIEMSQQLHAISVYVKQTSTHWSNLDIL